MLFSLIKKYTHFKPIFRKRVLSSIKEQERINQEREPEGKDLITLTIRDGVYFFAENAQFRDKFHHAKDLGSPIP